MSLIRAAILAMILPFSFAGAYIGYRMWSDWYYSGPNLSPQQQYDQATKKCLVAEATEGAASYNDQVLVVQAILRAAKSRNVDPCWLFSRYTLMRAPSQEQATAAIRDPDFVSWKSSFFGAASSREASAKKVVERALKGDYSFEPGEPQDVELARRRMLECVVKYHRVWRINTARTDVEAMRKEMGHSWKSPAGTEFFCAK